jgi:hypothetical protein
MTRLAVMQPYLFPYLGYWQLIRAVDRFVILDDVSYINRGWINRNRILVNGSATYFTIPLAQASQNRRICDIHLQGDGSWRDKLVRTLEVTYRRAPHFSEVFPFCERLLAFAEPRLAEYVTHQLMETAALLGLTTEFVPSSRCYGNDLLTGQERIVDICHREGATTYCNLPGGRSLYNAESFRCAGVALGFIAPVLAPYPQRSPQFVPGLSIIDVLMANGVVGTRAMVDSYCLDV